MRYARIPAAYLTDGVTDYTLSDTIHEIDLDAQRIGAYLGHCSVTLCTKLEKKDTVTIRYAWTLTKSEKVVGVFIVQVTDTPQHRKNSEFFWFERNPNVPYGCYH